MNKETNQFSLPPGMVNLLSHIKNNDTHYTPLFSRYSPNTNLSVVRRGGNIFGKLFQITSRRPN
ncbi:hypothetical protein [Desulforamulus ruminis]|uniref:hypothetical protein n=1 Tax=Desulforamulus ruminis TaxID=1564 RepID=UPI002357CD01|nr:hypothetical protein [Desulforamulus ruminis]